MARTLRFAPVLLVSLLVLGAAPRTALADQGRGNGKARGEEKAARARDEVVVIDRDGHRRIVRDYYTSNALPPGLAKRESLPPGLRKQLRERGALPPGLREHLTPVPPALGGRLPAVPPYYTRYFAGRDLLIVDTRTNRLASIIADAIP